MSGPGPVQVRTWSPVRTSTGPGPTILGPGPLHLDLDPDLGPRGPGPDFGQSRLNIVP